MARGTIAKVLGRRAVKPMLAVLAAGAAVLGPQVPTAVAQARPVVLSARALPGTLPAKGGTVEVVGKVRNATTCRLAVLGDQGVKVTLPKPANCADGTRSRCVPEVSACPICPAAPSLRGTERNVRTSIGYGRTDPSPSRSNAPKRSSALPDLTGPFHIKLVSPS